MLMGFEHGLWWIAARYNTRLDQSTGCTHPMSATQTPAERELAEIIVTALNLETVAAAQIDPEQPLFGEGLGLDSIDALELALEVSKRYGFQMRSDDENNRQIFASLRALSQHIAAHRTT
jgi:acyl carrier protein